MALIEEAIQNFRSKTLKVYKTDPERIIRDARAAERAITDHLGRWLFELLQNSDDAGASEVQVIITENTLYVADNGRGLRPQAVSALCGTDFSDKSGGTIGRKGIGFKSVYEISKTPQILTVNGEGIEFNPQKAESWLKQNGLNNSYVPYQWIPFLINWDKAVKDDPVLKRLENCKTVVRLPGLSVEKKQEIEQLINDWPPYALFTFRHLQRFIAPGFEVVLRPDEKAWSLIDTREQIPVHWRVIRVVENPPSELLVTINKNERDIISKDGVSFLLAAPLENELVVPTEDYLPIHVFYPTEQINPIPLFVHAEFLVKSDRTALIPFDASPFNQWVADRLAYHICIFINESYNPEKPSGHIALLVPFDNRESHLVTYALWKFIKNKAKGEVRLADSKAQPRLTVAETWLISVSVCTYLARSILEATTIRDSLLHSDFDTNMQARKALRELGCSEITDQKLMEIIAQNAGSLSPNKEWIWACWQWLSEWVAKKPYGEEHDERIERVRSLPIVPVGNSLVKISDLEGKIITWKLDTNVGDSLPNWLPLTFVDNWFRDRLLNESSNHALIIKLCEELGITKPGPDVIQRAVAQAIDQYWEDKQGDPGRFLVFILTQDWHENSKVKPRLKRCPVPLVKPIKGEKWAEARKAYFGVEWGEHLLAELYGNIEYVAWVSPFVLQNEKKKLRQLLEWLGVTSYPRIIQLRGEISIWQLPEDFKEWKKYLHQAKDDFGRQIEKIEKISVLDNITINDIGSRAGVFLLRIIAKFWNSYYKSKSEIKAKGTGYREQYYRTWSVKAKWWWEICEKLTVPRRDNHTGFVGLSKLWIPDKRSNRLIGDMLSVIDLEAYEDDRELVKDWLINEVSVRTRIDQLTLDEWKEILIERIPRTASVYKISKNERLRDKVTSWYVACLETVSDQDNVPDNAFASCPILCKKGDSWQYVIDEPRYLIDDNELSKVFTQDIWQFHVPERVAAQAVKYFGVIRLSEAVKVELKPEMQDSQLPQELLDTFQKTLPYIWAWRSSRSKQDAETLFTRLKRLQVQSVQTLKANFSLDGIQHEIERAWDAEGDTIYLLAEQADITGLALALAKVIGARSEADFYENLLRCSTDEERKKKLLNKGLVEDEIERCLREYSAQISESEPVEEEESSNISHPPMSKNDKEKNSNDETEVSQTYKGTRSSRNPRSGSSSPSTSRVPKRFKKVETNDYAVIEPNGTNSVKVGNNHSSDNVSSGYGTESDFPQLTEDEKKELEMAGRRFAKLELEKNNYKVKMMPFDNPGFDLLATKDGEELRVEVKAHAGQSSVVELTHRQLKEYLGQQGYRWELWNIEHLAENDPHEVTITKYSEISDDALYTRTFRVDLKKCKRK